MNVIVSACRLGFAHSVLRFVVDRGNDISFVWAQMRMSHVLFPSSAGIPLTLDTSVFLYGFYVPLVDRTAVSETGQGCRRNRMAAVGDGAAAIRDGTVVIRTGRQWLGEGEGSTSWRNASTVCRLCLAQASLRSSHYLQRNKRYGHEQDGASAAATGQQPPPLRQQQQRPASDGGIIAGERQGAAGSRWHAGGRRTLLVG